MRAKQEPVLQNDGLAIDSQLGLASGVIRILGQIAQSFKELVRLADEKPILRQGFDRTHGCSLLSQLDE